MDRESSEMHGLSLQGRFTVAFGQLRRGFGNSTRALRLL
jgi:hypothetical protein